MPLSAIASAPVSLGSSDDCLTQSPATEVTAETGPAPTLLDVEQAAINLLASRDHSRVELERKLATRDFPAELVCACLDALAARGYINDERFTEQYLRMRRQRGFGPLRIRKELRERGISSDLISAWLDEKDSHWRDDLRALTERKFGALDDRSSKELARRARFLEYRGFPAQLIRDYLFRD